MAQPDDQPVRVEGCGIVSPASKSKLSRPLEDLAQLLAEALAKRWLEEQWFRCAAINEKEINMAVFVAEVPREVAELQAAQGWTDETLLRLALAYIEEMDEIMEFENFLRNRVSEELDNGG